MPPLQEEQGVPNSSQVDGNVRHIDSKALVSQPVALILVQSAEAEASVLANDPKATKDDARGSEDDYLSGIRLVLAISALTLSATLIFLDNSILSTAIPTITNEFHSTADIGWYISSYQLALSALQPTTGKLFTYLPNKWTYIASIVVFELGSLICALANSSRMLIGGRIVAGLGASGLFNGAMTIITALVPLQKRPAVTGIFMGCFWINLPIGGLAILVLILVHIPEQHHKTPIRTFLRSPHLIRTFDIGGALILIPSVVMILLALQFGGTTHPWGSATVIGLFIGFGATAALFIAWEWRVAGKDAMLPMALFQNRVVVAAFLTTVCVFGCTFISSYFLPIYFQSIQGSSPFTSGLHMLPSILSQMLMAVVSGVGVSKLGYYLPWAVSAGVVMTIGSALITTWSTTTGMGKWIGYQIILGLGRGAALQQGMIALQTVLPDSQVAVAMAVMMFLQGLIGSVVISVANTIFDNSLLSEIRAGAPSANAEAVLAAGATAFRKVVSSEQLAAVLEAYAVSFDRVFYLAVGLTAAMFFTSLGLGWHDVREKKARTGGGPSTIRTEKGDANV
ncbi:hypothetical protein N0V82_002056 [Gnomoniopsis sp. IMI 355080]|nr:hypothetical protein N0V82_002056 [Gnomoniopsis sp. IMI 355080]